MGRAAGAIVGALCGVFGWNATCFTVYGPPPVNTLDDPLVVLVVVLGIVITVLSGAVGFFAAER